MGLLSFLKRLLFGAPASNDAPARPKPSNDPASRPATPPASPPSTDGTATKKRVRLTPMRRQGPRERGQPARETARPPYPYAFPTYGGKFLDLSDGTDFERLRQFGLPELVYPGQLAEWLQLPLGHVAWLTYRFCDGNRPQTAGQAHYHFHWVRKKSGGHRLIEAPKSRLRRVQDQILREILDRVPSHPAAHGFVRGRSIVTNAEPHVGHKFVFKLDLENFYPSVRYSRVVATFRSLGYSREIAIWLARLTTSLIPTDLPTPGQRPGMLYAYFGRHLPQGASTSPAIANLSALGLDIRLSGLANAYGCTYTRYADDLTLSGPGKAAGALRELIPLSEQIVRSERFHLHPVKRRILRRGQRMRVTGVVVNDKVNIARGDFDRLKAILTNCIRTGPEAQNREGLPAFSDHLRGRIAHITQLNPNRGAKLQALFARIRWP
ncbi:reverse transcriptase family protein [Planctomyces sp. SH-PL14]|uniref:reverse transcriptase family protein n=1 Tax=Planctomyces sp. SH-PL14 TaxID=1632864 RepID=UPI00078EADC0|nr:reverse transcriptase family protein [Planctomyces sp. SH-PL14]AMV17493.1 Reverse transcriptase (RNA-dependent DNA polymerase) [Planctomyces sp. SH-PL14]